MPTVGILALQGDVQEHARALDESGLRTRSIRRPADLGELDGLVLPGGESTTMLKLLHIQQLEEPLGELLRSGLPVFATCAGVILCAREVIEPEQRSYGVLDLKVSRNGYGRQIHSGTIPLTPEPGSDLPADLRGVFIRAPKVIEIGSACRVLARRDGDPVLVEQGNILGACFHPELELDHPVSRLFAERVLRHARLRQNVG